MSRIVVTGAQSTLTWDLKEYVVKMLASDRLSYDGDVVLVPLDRLSNAAGDGDLVVVNVPSDEVTHLVKRVDEIYGDTKHFTIYADPTTFDHDEHHCDENTGVWKSIKLSLSSSKSFTNEKERPPPPTVDAHPVSDSDDALFALAASRYSTDEGIRRAYLRLRRLREEIRTIKDECGNATSSPRGPPHGPTLTMYVAYLVSLYVVLLVKGFWMANNPFVSAFCLAIVITTTVDATRV